MTFVTNLLLAMAVFVPISGFAQNFANLPRPGQPTVTPVSQAPGAVAPTQNTVTAPTPLTTQPAPVPTAAAESKPGVTSAANNPFMRQRAPVASIANKPGFNQTFNAPVSGGFNPNPSVNPTPAPINNQVQPSAPAAIPPEEHPVKKDGKLLGVVNGQAVYKANTYYFDKPGVEPKVSTAPLTQPATQAAAPANVRSPRR